MLIRTIKSRGIRKGLTERVEKVIRETKNRVRGRVGKAVLDSERGKARLFLESDFAQLTVDRCGGGNGKN